jgi:hypothetical protein
MMIALPLILALALQEPAAAAAQTEAAAQPPATAPQTAAPSPAAPQPGPRAPRIDDKTVAPDGPLREPDVTYQNRVLSNFQASQGRQGPFDGRWTVSGSAGDMFVLQLTDPGEGGHIEGAWRDVRRAGGGRSGLIDSITRDGDNVIVNFVEAQGGAPVEVRLRSPQPGGWLGEANTPEGGRQSIVMHRASGVEAQAAAAPYVSQPRAYQPSRATVDPTPTRGKAKKGHHAASQRHGHATAKSHSRGSQHSTSRSAHSKSSKKPAAHSSSSKKSSSSSVKSSSKKSSSAKKSTVAKKSTSAKKKPQ